MAPIITVSHLSKKYFLGKRLPYYSLRDTVMDTLKHPAHLLRPLGTHTEAEEFWALKDVSFEIPSGQVVGVIGRNGAGKSTLLKVLSRITTPTAGEVRISGRVASLLEVGTGFNPELTGRENVFLNGAILGMSQKEIKRKYSEIVSFSEIEKFMDTPVKFYSSGMYVRLAFAVAAHLEAEILIVDEVLAVGDSSFQKKCLTKMNEVSKKGGRTVLFVSHNLGAIEQMTQRCLVLQHGKLEMDADNHEAVSFYLNSMSSSDSINLHTWKERKGSGEVKVVDFQTCSLEDVPREYFHPGEPIKITIDVEFMKSVIADIGVSIESKNRWPLFTTQLSDMVKLKKSVGRRKFEMIITPSPLRPGQYLLTLWVISPDRQLTYDVVYHLPAIQIEGYDSRRKFPLDARPGEIYLPCKWKISEGKTKQGEQLISSNE